MGDETKDSLKRQMERKRRVKRIKSGIVLTLFGWILVSMILSIILFCKVNSLEHKMEDLLTSSAQKTESTQVEAEMNANPPAVSKTELYSKEEDNSNDETTDEENILASSITVDDANLAEEGDTLKVYLTFDDGPSDNTAEILDILERYNVKATFFVIAQEDEQYVDAYQRIVNEGHTLAMHSYTHQYAQVYSSLESFQEDVTRLHDFLYDITGIDCKYYRFPGGSSNRVSGSRLPSFIHYLNDEGITYYDWNISNGDATSQVYTSDELVQNVMNDVTKYKTSVVLMHDTTDKHTTVEALAKLIESLMAIHAEILPIDDNTTLVQHIHADSVG